jgi:hypothetical protein
MRMLVCHWQTVRQVGNAGDAPFGLTGVTER